MGSPGLVEPSLKYVPLLAWGLIPETGDIVWWVV